MTLAANRGNISVQWLIKHISIEKNQGIQGLPLGGSRHLTLRCRIRTQSDTQSVDSEAPPVPDPSTGEPGWAEISACF